METSREKLRGALEAILVDAGKEVSKTFKDTDVTVSCVGGKWSVEATGAYEATVNCHPAVNQLREIFTQAQHDFGDAALPRCVYGVTIRNARVTREKL